MTTKVSPPTASQFRNAMKLAGWPPKKKFKTEDERQLLQEIHADRKRHHKISH